MTRDPVARLALGTVQFGMPYGVSNTGGQVPEARVKAILGAAANAGIDLLDTAAAYGDAEAVISRASAGLGQRFLVVSKTPPGGTTDAVMAAARRSAELAGGEGLDAILVHHPADLVGRAGDRLWRALQGLVDEGAVRRVGLSASFDDHPRDLAARFAPAVIQLPVSLFDQRLVRDGTLAEFVARGIEIHARSIYLQGLLFAGEDRLPPAIRGVATLLDAKRRMIRACGATLVEAAIGYVLAQSEIRRIVVGLTSLDELDEMLAAAAASRDDIPWHDVALDDATALNPSRWTAA
jgi:aryl-alcohol dehydrogenase-like predicted oxidoreductase